MSKPCISEKECCEMNPELNISISINASFWLELAGKAEGNKTFLVVK